MKHNVIWSNTFDALNIENYDFDGMEELTDEQKQGLVYEWNYDDFECEKENLNEELPEDIICIGDIGRWDGRLSGYKLLNNNLNSIFEVYEDGAYGDNEYYCDAWNARGTGHHHDGTNYYLFRMMREGLSWEQKDNFFDKLYRGTATKKDVSRYTVSIRPYIAKVYGW